MSPHREQPERLVVTAALTTGVGCVAHGMQEAASLVGKVLTMDHREWETILLIGDVEYHQTTEGPYPDQQMRVSVRPSAGYAALNHTNNSDANLAIANSFNPTLPPPNFYLIFNGETGAVFPRTAAIPIPEARNALREWLRTRRRPTCIAWRPYDAY